MTSFSSVCGHAAIKQKLVEVILWPRLYSELYRAFGVQAGDVGILLYGPPGTGKTLLPRVLSSHLKINLLNMKLSDVVRGEVGSSEKAVVAVFNEAKRTAPCIIFVDEFQALFTSRQGSADRDDQTGTSLSSTLAICFDDLRLWNQVNPSSLVTVIAASNEPWCIDNTFLRSGRMSVCLYVGALDGEGRMDFLRQRLVEMLRNVKVDRKNVEFPPEIRENDDVLDNNSNNNNSHLTQLTPTQVSHYTHELLSSSSWLPLVVDLTEGFTGADMALLFNRAVIEMNKGGAKEVQEEVQPATSVDTLNSETILITQPVAAALQYDAPFVPYVKSLTPTPFVPFDFTQIPLSVTSTSTSSSHDKPKVNHSTSLLRTAALLGVTLQPEEDSSEEEVLYEDHKVTDACIARFMSPENDLSSHSGASSSSSSGSSRAYGNESEELRELYLGYTKWCEKEVEREKNRSVKFESVDVDTVDSISTSLENIALQQLTQSESVTQTDKQIETQSTTQNTMLTPTSRVLFNLSHYLPSLPHFKEALRSTRKSVTRSEVEEYERWDKFDRGK